jgi:hypothetical protein
MPEPKLTEDDLKDIILAFSEARMKPYLNATNNSYSDMNNKLICKYKSRQ